MAAKKKANPQEKSDQNQEKKRGPGRPEVYTPELAAQICAELAQGKSLRSISRDNDWCPAPATIFEWIRTKEGFLNQYEQAKRESADAMAEDMLEIADNEAGNPLVVEGVPMVIDGKPVIVKDSPSVAHARLRVDTRKWLMSKMMPKKYGDKLDLGGELPVTITEIKRVIVRE